MAIAVALHAGAVSAYAFASLKRVDVRSGTVFNRLD